MSGQSFSVNIAIAYVLWGLGFFGLCGLHRFYLGKPVSGLIWLFTFGGFFVGQIVDAFLIPKLVREKQMSLEGKAETDLSLVANTQTEQKLVQPIQKLLKAAKDNGNVLSLGQAIIATGLPTDEVEELLTEALRKDLAKIDNDRESGAVRYYFDI